MKNVENLNAPSAAGWALGLAAGLVAFAVAKVIGGFDFMPSALFGVLVMLAAGLVLGMPWGAAVPAASASDAVAPKAEAVAEPVKVAEVAAVAAAPVAEAPAPAAKVAKAAKVADAAAAKPAAKAAAAPKAAAPAKAGKAAATPKAAAAAKVADVPAAAAEGTKPKALKGPRKGAADDLKAIEGIGPALEKLCHGLGIYHFDQIAGWGEAEVAWMDANLKGFKGRVTRDKWVAQAKLIGEVGMDEFLNRAKTNNY